MPPEDADPAATCPVDPQTRERWLEAARAKGQQAPAHPHATIVGAPPLPAHAASTRFSLDTLSWQPLSPAKPPVPVTSSLRPKMYSLSTDREISTIPRAIPTTRDRTLKPEELAALPHPTSTPPPPPASHGAPANAEGDTGHDRDSGNWIYPSQEMFFNAMRRKGHDAQERDMQSIVPIHNAVNERAWTEIKQWEAGRGSESCGGPKLVSFSGDSKRLTPKARWNNWVLGYQVPFDRHDWVVDRCGTQIDYVIDFYSGKDNGLGTGLAFYLDVRPKLNSWEGVKMRAQRLLG
ncbi:putative cytochrome c1 heme lyase [Teratosphaeria destructans]|uniref:Holocytochrome c-type synthase n=1 Tax=Teratosphaeria destructans TaxID=418781 RepID=A0A9W7SN33_9PEZI|nr:putative cytochrome c1 heme lyase [Teratosphaeria destructans]